MAESILAPSTPGSSSSLMATYTQTPQFLAFSPEDGLTPSDWADSLVDDYDFGQPSSLLSPSNRVAEPDSAFGPLFLPPFTGPLVQAQLDSSDCFRSHANIADEGGVGAKPCSRLRCPVEGCTNKAGFERESDLNRHRAKHEKPYSCPEATCSRPFGSRADMLRHRREVHGKDENNTQPSDHYCPVPSCKRSRKGFARFWNMQQHLKKMHSDSAGASTSIAGSPGSLSSDNDPLTPISSNESGASPLTRRPPPTWPLGMADPSCGITTRDNDELAFVQMRLDELRSKRGKLDQNIEAYEKLRHSLRDDVE